MRLTIFAILLISLPFARQAQGQERADIVTKFSGVVSNDKGAPLVNANVMLYHGDTLVVRQLTDFDGKYAIASALIHADSSYRLKACYQGRETVCFLKGVANLSYIKLDFRIETGVSKGRLGWSRPSGCPSYLDPEHPGGRKTWCAGEMPVGW